MPATRGLTTMAIKEAELSRQISMNYLAATDLAEQALALLQ
jgi:hypothetical protein